MTLAGFIFMALSWGFILYLVIYTFYKIFTSGNKDAIGPRDFGI
jgi:hypothetical protein